MISQIGKDVYKDILQFSMKYADVFLCVHYDSTGQSFLSRLKKHGNSCLPNRQRQTQMPVAGMNI